MSYLGLDIGTTGCKALAFGADGSPYALAYREYATHFGADGSAELDVAVVVKNCRAVIREAAAACAENDPVQALAVSSQGEAVTPVGANGAFLAPAMISSDARPAPTVMRYASEAGHLYDVTGHTAHPMFTLFKFAYLREASPDMWRQAAHFFCFEDLLHYVLGVEKPTISWSLAGRTMLFDVRRHEWDAELLRGADVSGRLARPLPSGVVAGVVSDAAAARCGLPTGVKVVTGGHDQVCAALGCGAVAPGTATYALGTVECLTATLEGAVFADAMRSGNLCTYDHCVPGRYATIAYTLTGGNLFRWFRDEWGQVEAAQAERDGENVFDKLFALMPPTPTTLIALPYFTPTGTPFFDVEATGAILGLRLSTKRGEVLRALLEGLAFEMRRNLTILEGAGISVEELRVTGGGSLHRDVLQIRADVLGRDVVRVETAQAGCLGAALLACAAHTRTPVELLAAQWVRTGERVSPNPQNAAFYSDRFAAYLKLYPALRDLAPSRAL